MICNEKRHVERYGRADVEKWIIEKGRLEWWDLVQRVENVEDATKKVGSTGRGWK